MESIKHLDLKSTEFSIDLKESKILNERRTIFQLVRKLLLVQDECVYEEFIRRLWQDVVEKGIDLDRVINLMYSCSVHEDDTEMTKLDEIYQRTGLVG